MAIAASLGFVEPPDDLREMERTPIVVHCSECSWEWAVGFAPVPVDIFSRAARSLGRACPQCGKKASTMMGWAPKPLTTPNIWAWIFSGQTGSSSLTIWRFMQGRHPPSPHEVQRKDRFPYGATPQDSWDFERCERLLSIAPPAWRERLPGLGEQFKAWKPIVERWSELAQALAEGKREDITRTLEELRGERS